MSPSSPAMADPSGAELEAVRAFVRSVYELDGELERLGGENLNVAIAEGDRRLVLKIAMQGQTPEELEFEHALAEHIARSEVALSVPRTIAAADGSLVSTFVDPAGTYRPARLTRFVGGAPWRCVAAPSADLRRDLGRRLAALDLALADFAHPVAKRSHRWDLTRAGRHRSKVSAAPDPERRDLLDAAFRTFNAVARPLLPELRRSVIHADANDENVLVDDGRVVGLVDLGDALDNPVICELAIACAYTMLGCPEPAAAGGDLVAGYHQVRPLSPEELSALTGLVLGRIAASLAIAADRRRAHPEHATYYTTEPAAWELLERLVAAGPRLTREALVRQVEPAPPSPLTVELLLADRRRLLGPSLSVSYADPLVILRGRAQYLFDADERPYLDLVNNVCHVGHCHPRVVAAGQAQMERLNTNTRYLHPGLGEYAERLCATLPAELEVCYFVNSGSEANELSLRLARAATGRRDLLVVEGAYHGHTSSLVEASPYKFLGPGGSGRCEPWIHTVPMPDSFRGRFRGDGTGEAYAETVREELARTESEIGAFIIEPLLGCGGQIVPPEGYLAAAFDHVRAAGAVAIADEVQVGFGRVGSHFWAFDAQGARPDVVTLGKPIGNGHPMAAVVTTRAIADAFANGMEFFSTFGGNPVSCAIGLAVLEVIADEGLQQRALELGELFLRGFEELAQRHELIGDVRGLGLFLGVELVLDHDSLEPAAAETAAIVERMRKRGVLMATDGPLRNVLKVKPPMVLDRGDIEMTLRGLDDELSRLG